MSKINERRQMAQEWLWLAEALDQEKITGYRLFLTDVHRDGMRGFFIVAAHINPEHTLSDPLAIAGINRPPANKEQAKVQVTAAIMSLTHWVTNPELMGENLSVG